MTAATNTRPRKPAGPMPERTLHTMLGALETAGERVARFAHQSDARLVRRTKRRTHKAKTS